MVEVYTNEGCLPCRSTKRFLTQNNVKFVEKSVQEPENLEFVKSLGHSSVPVIVTPSGENWSGNRPDRLMTLV